MALTMKKKQELVQEYSERLGRTQVLIWSKYRGLSVAQVQALRGQLRGVGAEAVVVKNTLMGIALDEAHWQRDHDIMSGPSLVTFIYDDIAPATKVLVEFARRNADGLQIAGGLVGGRLATADQVRSLTDMPSREMLLAQVVGGIQAPISAFVGVLAASVRGIMNVLNARAEQLGGDEAPAEA